MVLTEDGDKVPVGSKALDECLGAVTAVRTDVVIWDLVARRVSTVVAAVAMVEVVAMIVRALLMVTVVVALTSEVLTRVVVPTWPIVVVAMVKVAIRDAELADDIAVVAVVVLLLLAGAGLVVVVVVLATVLTDVDVMLGMVRRLTNVGVAPGSVDKVRVDGEAVLGVVMGLVMPSKLTELQAPPLVPSPQQVPVSESVSSAINASEEE